jgi:hypothetical protein
MIVVLSAFSVTVTAQTKGYISGYVKDKQTKHPLAFASITNLSTNKTTMTDEEGKFMIEVKVNQLLSFSSVGYNFDTVRITEQLISQASQYFFLSPLVHQLSGVTVTSLSKYNKYQLDSIERRKNYFGDRSDAKIPVASLANSGAGMGINIDHFYKREKNRSNWIDMFGVMEKEAYINYFYPPELVNKYTNLHADSLTNFIQFSRPKYEWLRKHNSDEDLLYYINDKLKSYYKRKH